MSVSFAFLRPLSELFAKSQTGYNQEFHEMIMHIYYFDAGGSAISLGINAAVMALLFGLGYTKLTLLINFCRVFVYRIPVLWVLQNFTDLGSEAVGVMMMISNSFTSITAFVIALVVLHKIKKRNESG
jgi:Na+-driven multidrug efflux pump